MPKGTRRTGRTTYTESPYFSGGGSYSSSGARSDGTGESHARRVVGDSAMSKAKSGTRYRESVGVRQGFVTTRTGSMSPSKSAPVDSRKSHTGSVGSPAVAKSTITPPRAGRGADMTRYKGRTIGSVSNRAYTSGTRRVR